MNSSQRPLLRRHRRGRVVGHAVHAPRLLERAPLGEERGEVLVWRGARARSGDEQADREGGKQERAKHARTISGFAAPGVPGRLVSRRAGTRSMRVAISDSAAAAATKGRDSGASTQLHPSFNPAPTQLQPSSDLAFKPASFAVDERRPERLARGGPPSHIRWPSLCPAKRSTGKVPSPPDKRRRFGEHLTRPIADTAVACGSASGYRFAYDAAIWLQSRDAGAHTDRSERATSGSMRFSNTRLNTSRTALV